MPPSSPDNGPPLSLAARMLYSAGDMAITMTMVLMGLFAVFFYNSVMGLPAWMAGVGVAAGLVLEALLDPYIGHRSDRCQSRFGRRHAWMFPGALAMGPGFFLLFSPPQGMGQTALFAWLLMSSFVFRSAAALYRIPYLSLGAELARDYDARTSLMAMRALFGLLGTMLAAGISFGLLRSRMEYDRYPVMALLFSVLMTGSGFAAVFGTWRERARLPGATQDSTTFRHFREGLRSLSKNRSFRSVWSSTTLFFLAVVLNATLAVHYFNWYARVRDGGSISSIQVSFYVGALAGVLAWMGLARQAEKRTLYLISIFGTAVLLSLATLLVGPGHWFSNGAVLPLAAGHAAAGCFASALWVVPSSMLADVADQDATTTGLRREGIYFGVLNFSEKVASGGAALLAGALLNFFVRLPSGPATPGLTAIERLGWLYGILPGTILALAAACILPYRLNRQSVHDLQQKLALREAAHCISATSTHSPAG